MRIDNKLYDQLFTMVPYRDEIGNIDIYNKNKLAKQRLTTLAHDGKIKHSGPKTRIC
mgnify:CR=1 FL=1